MAELTNQVVSRQEWLDARKRLLIKEKEYTRLGDQLSEERRRLPWERGIDIRWTGRKRDSRGAVRGQ